jgi:hypothetical protein
MTYEQALKKCDKLSEQLFKHGFGCFMVLTATGNTKYHVISNVPRSAVSNGLRRLADDLDRHLN